MPLAQVWRLLQFFASLPGGGVGWQSAQNEGLLPGSARSELPLVRSIFPAGSLRLILGFQLSTLIEPSPFQAEYLVDQGVLFRTRFFDIVLMNDVDAFPFYFSLSDRSLSEDVLVSSNGVYVPEMHLPVRVGVQLELGAVYATKLFLRFRYFVTIQWSPKPENGSGCRV